MKPSLPTITEGFSPKIPPFIVTLGHRKEGSFILKVNFSAFRGGFKIPLLLILGRKIKIK